MLRRSLKKRAARSAPRRGASAVEFAVVAPVLFLFVFGIIEIGRMMMVQQALTNAAREGCREACLATTTSSSDVDTIVRGTLQRVIPNANDPLIVQVGTTPSALSGISSGTPIAVGLQVQFSDISWLPGNFLSYLGDPVISAQTIQDRE